MVRAPTDSIGRQIFNAFADLAARIVQRNDLMPPFSMRRFVGESRFDLRGRDFAATGRHFLSKLQADAGLNAESRVLDVGSGCGRIAIPLTSVIKPAGLYRGLEVSKPLVKWCERTITPRYSYFQFVHSDVYSSFYNPKGKLAETEYEFPFSNASFDLVIATSLFTHLLPPMAEHYIAECARVLTPKGLLFATFFLPESGMRSPDGRISFNHPYDRMSFVVNPARPQEAIAFRSEWVIEQFTKRGMAASEPRWGHWTGRADGYSGQDVIISNKRH